MARFTKKAFEPLDREEQELIASLEEREWQEVVNKAGDIEQATIAARNTIKKDKRINVLAKKIIIKYN